MTTLQDIFKSPDAAKLWAQVIAFAPVLFQITRCLREFGVLKSLSAAENGMTFDEIQRQVDLPEYGLNVILSGGESAALLSQRDGRYHITTAGRCLQSDPMTRVNMNFTQDVCYQGLFFLEESLRQQSPKGLKVFGDWPTIYEGLTQLPPPVLQSWLQFDHFYSDDAFPGAIEYIFKENPKTILDVGGNTGKFAIACANYNADVRVRILDYPQQLSLAENEAQKLGFAARIKFQAQKLLDHSLPFPEGYDVIWMSQFLDCFGKDDILSLLKRARKAMSAKATLYIMEPFTDRQKYEAGKLCLNMISAYFTCMANGQSRMYRAEEFYQLLGQAGLVVVEERSLRLSHTILKCRAG